MRALTPAALAAVGKRIRRRGLLVAAVLALAVGVAAAAILLTRGGAATSEASGVAAHDSRNPGSLASRFAVLHRAHSNRCGMPASALDAMPPDARLQGACCFPMDYHAYATQRRALKRYAGVDVIPQDPYDVSVTLAKRLIGYQSIALTPEQTRTYQRAVPLSETKGPCCCPCWRWTAFGGQAKYLITRRSYSAKQIAEVWSLEEGCGGAGGKA
jgi:hypothetical protein